MSTARGTHAEFSIQGYCVHFWLLENSALYIITGLRPFHMRNILFLTSREALIQTCTFLQLFQKMQSRTNSWLNLPLGRWSTFCIVTGGLSRCCISKVANHCCNKRHASKCRLNCKGLQYALMSSMVFNLPLKQSLAICERLDQTHEV